jgi:hypothetical protein
MSTTKISIRFFDDREVRAVWDEDKSKWWFSALDIIAVLTDQNDYSKNRNYWKYLKAKFKKENSQVVSATTQLKLRVNLPHLRQLRETRPTPNFLQLNPRKSAPSALTAFYQILRKSAKSAGDTSHSKFSSIKSTKICPIRFICVLSNKAKPLLLSKLRHKKSPFKK